MELLEDSGATSSVGRHEHDELPRSLSEISFEPLAAEPSLPKTLHLDDAPTQPGPVPGPALVTPPFAHATRALARAIPRAPLLVAALALSAFVLPSVVPPRLVNRNFELTREERTRVDANARMAAAGERHARAASCAALVGDGAPVVAREVCFLTRMIVELCFLNCDGAPVVACEVRFSTRLIVELCFLNSYIITPQIDICYEMVWLPFHLR